MEPKALGAQCAGCSLAMERFVPASGPTDQNALIIVGEAPGVEEVKVGEPFVGPSGKLLSAIVEDRIPLYKTNVVACRPPQNRTPTYLEISCCKGRLFNELRAHPSRTVMALGKTAAELLVPGYETAQRGSWVAWEDKKVIPSWHPAYVLRKPTEVDALIRDINVAIIGYTPPRFTTPPEAVIIQSPDHLRDMLYKCPDGAIVGFDIETDQVEWYDKPSRKADAILCLTLAWCDEYGIVIDDSLLYDTPPIRHILNDFITSRKDITFCAHNAQFDLVFLEGQLGIKFRCDFDTMLSDYVLNENKRHALKPGIIMDLFGLRDYEEELISSYLSSRNDRYSKIPFDKLSLYGVWDVVVTRAVMQVYKERLIKEGLYQWPFMNVLMASLPNMVQMELGGLKVDVPYLQNAQILMLKRMDAIAGEARAMFDLPELNLNSTAQVATILFDRLRLLPSKSPRIKPRSTAHDAVEHLKGKHPFVDNLMQYRRVAKIKSSYVDNMLEFADCQGRVHPQPLLMGTEIGRLAMRDPAAQTIPRPGKPDAPGYDPYLDGAIIRGAIIAEEGCVLVMADHSQAELRVAAYLSGEPFLLEAYRNDEDLHTKVALRMFGPNFTKEQRARCKMFNFSYLYGGSEYSFAMDAGLPIQIARDFVKDYNRMMSQLARFRVTQYEYLVAHGYVQSLLGRRRRFPLIVDENRDDARKSAVHMPVASTASDLTLLASNELRRLGLTVVLLVHDSIAVECPEKDGPEVAEIMRREMLKVVETHLGGMPWKVDTEISKRWAEPPRL